MEHPVRRVANALLYKAKQHGKQLTHMQLQKLVFFSHAWNLALTGRALTDERPEAWQYGPVYPSIYHELKSFGSSHIDGYLKEFDPHAGRMIELIPDINNSQFWGLIDQVWQKYGHFNAIQLSSLSHETGGPWEKVRKQYDLSAYSASMTRQSYEPYIPDEWIRDFYQSKLQNGV